ncbi:MAG: 4-(cytidine 5'-diphospho)-2-C-methyl-D-erythritol kinase [Lentisphaeria bacterium]|nr:4-(cytidine 5'-diphospho)-2-C-methyl-D-erythritol kinase [Lentisphaeria bacterium]
MKTGGKINLFLKVTGKRPDHYHELITLFLPLSAPFDTLDLHEGADGITLTQNGMALPDQAENLVIRAARAYAEAAGIAPAWHFVMQKEIPIAAGLGGGSADAAAALKLLQNRYGALPQPELARIALSIGADVPFFLDPRPAVATGVGEDCRPLSGAVPPLPVVLVNPRFPVSAKWAYCNLDPDRIGAAEPGKLESLTAALLAGDPAGVAAGLHNDLAYALYEKFPLLGIIRDFLCANGALNAEITGSGSSLYGICPDFTARDRLAMALREKFGDTLLVYATASGAAPA